MFGLKWIGIRDSLGYRFPVVSKRNHDFYTMMARKSRRPGVLPDQVAQEIGISSNTPNEMSIADLYRIVYDCYAWVQATTAYQREMFRPTLLVKPRFAYRCDSCDFETEVDGESTCPKCKQPMRQPDNNQEMLAIMANNTSAAPCCKDVAGDASILATPAKVSAITFGLSADIAKPAEMMPAALAFSMRRSSPGVPMTSPGSGRRSHF